MAVQSEREVKRLLFGFQDRGVTVHSLFGLNANLETSLEYGTMTYKRIASLDVVIVDEVSMMHSVMFATIEKILRRMAAKGNMAPLAAPSLAPQLAPLLDPRLAQLAPLPAPLPAAPFPGELPWPRREKRNPGLSVSLVLYDLET